MRVQNQFFASLNCSGVYYCVLFVVYSTSEGNFVAFCTSAPIFLWHVCGSFSLLCQNWYEHNIQYSWMCFKERGCIKNGGGGNTRKW